MATTPLIAIQLADLLARAERGELRSLAVAWEADGEQNGVASEFYVSEDGNPPLLLGELTTMASQLAEDIRTERWEAAELLDDDADSLPPPPDLTVPKGAPN